MVGRGFSAGLAGPSGAESPARRARRPCIGARCRYGIGALVRIWNPAARPRGSTNSRLPRFQIVWKSLDSLVRISTFQRVARDGRRLFSRVGSGSCEARANRPASLRAVTERPLGSASLFPCQTAGRSRRLHSSPSNDIVMEFCFSQHLSPRLLRGPWRRGAAAQRSLSRRFSCRRAARLCAAA